jgi:hypothetical protein
LFLAVSGKRRERRVLYGPWRASVNDRASNRRGPERGFGNAALLIGMAKDHAERPDIFAGPPCERCGKATRLLSVAQHRRRRRSLTCIFECTACAATDKIEMLMPRRPH